VAVENTVGRQLPRQQDHDYDRHHGNEQAEEYRKLAEVSVEPGYRASVAPEVHDDERGHAEHEGHVDQVEAEPGYGVYL
jgi:hypothetical protein